MRKGILALLLGIYVGVVIPGLFSSSIASFIVVNHVLSKVLGKNPDASKMREDYHIPEHCDALTQDFQEWVETTAKLGYAFELTRKGARYFGEECARLGYRPLDDCTLGAFFVTLGLATLKLSLIAAIGGYATATDMLGRRGLAWVRRGLLYLV